MYVFVHSNYFKDRLTRISVVSGKTMFDVLPPQLKSLAVRTKVRYVSRGHILLGDGLHTDHWQSPHPYVWMSKAHALPTGLGLETEGLELPEEELPEWEESKVKVFPMVSLAVRVMIKILIPDYRSAGRTQ